MYNWLISSEGNFYWIDDDWSDYLMPNWRIYPPGYFYY